MAEASGFIARLASRRSPVSRSAKDIATSASISSCATVSWVRGCTSGISYVGQRRIKYPVPYIIGLIFCPCKFKGSLVDDVVAHNDTGMGIIHVKIGKAWYVVGTLETNVDRPFAIEPCLSQDYSFCQRCFLWSFRQHVRDKHTGASKICRFPVRLAQGVIQLTLPMFGQVLPQ